MLCFAMHAPRILGVEEDSAASCKVHSRVRHFGGVFATPVHNHSYGMLPYAVCRMPGSRTEQSRQHDMMTEAAHAKALPLGGTECRGTAVIIAASRVMSLYRAQDS